MRSTLVEELEQAATMLERLNCGARGVMHIEDRCAVCGAPARLRARAAHVRDEEAYQKAEASKGNDYAACASEVLARLTGPIPVTTP